jgi:hypothetical protein
MNQKKKNNPPETESADTATPDHSSASAEEQSGERPREIGGRDGPEPTRYGDWEKNGRCIDF